MGVVGVIGAVGAVAGAAGTIAGAFGGEDAPSGGGAGAAGSSAAEMALAEAQIAYMEQAREDVLAAAEYDKSLEARRRSMQNQLGSEAQLAGVPDYLVEGGDNFQAPVDAEGNPIEGASWRQGFNAGKAWKGLVKSTKEAAKAAGEKPRDAVKALKTQGLSRKALKENADLWKQSYAAAAEGDYERAQELRNQAQAQLGELGLVGEDGSISEALSAEGVGGADFHQMKMGPEAKAAWKDLQSPTALMVGERVSEAAALQDPESEESKRFMASMVDDPVAELELAEDQSYDALALAERESARASRDFSGAAGSMRSFGAEQAMRDRSSERFGLGYAMTRQQTAVAKAKVFGEAARFYNEYRTAYADSALAAAENWVNNQSFVRDSFRSLQMSAATALAGIATTGAQLAQQTGMTAMAISSNERLANQEMAFAAQQAKAESIANMSGALMGASGSLLKYAAGA